MTPRTETEPEAVAPVPLNALPSWDATQPGGETTLRPRLVRVPVAATLIPYVAVLVLVTAGVYISWHQGSHGGGLGGVVAGAAFLLAAGVRILLPKQLAGFLASRKKATDVTTLVVFGAGLLLLGLVLPG